MILNNSSNIDNDGIRPVENFLRAPQVETFLQKNLTFYLIFALNQLQMGMKPKNDRLHAFMAVESFLRNV